MNIALGALIITLLLLPALFFRMGISLLSLLTIRDIPEGPVQDVSSKRRLRNRNYRQMVSNNLTFLLDKFNFSEIIFLFLIIPLLLHLVSLIFLHHYDKKIDYDLLFNLLASKQNVVKDVGNDTFQEMMIGFLKYICWECVIAMFAGWFIAEMFVRFSRTAARWFLGNNRSPLP